MRRPRRGTKTSTDGATTHPVRIGFDAASRYLKDMNNTARSVVLFSSLLIVGCSAAGGGRTSRPRDTTAPDLRSDSPNDMAHPPDYDDLGDVVATPDLGPDAATDLAEPSPTLSDQAWCETSLPCGGDPTGAWRSATDCAETTLSSCPDHPIQRTIYSTATRIYKFSATQVEVSAVGTFDYVSSYHLSCLGSLVCTELSESNVTCTNESADWCSCRTIRNYDSHQQVEYTRTGFHLTIESAGEPITFSYCVSGDRLLLRKDGSSQVFHRCATDDCT